MLRVLVAPGGLGPGGVVRGVIRGGGGGGGSASEVQHRPALQGPSRAHATRRDSWETRRGFLHLQGQSSQPLDLPLHHVLALVLLLLRLGPLRPLRASVGNLLHNRPEQGVDVRHVVKVRLREKYSLVNVAALAPAVRLLT